MSTKVGQRDPLISKPSGLIHEESGCLLGIFQTFDLLFVLAELVQYGLDIALATKFILAQLVQYGLGRMLFQSLLSRCAS